MSAEEEEIRNLMEDAQQAIEAENLKDAGEIIHRAIKIAENMGNEDLTNQILKFVHGFTYSTEPQAIELNPVKTEGLILDIGGGGEGIIGRLNGRQVVAIDTSKRELAETKNEALKVVMDATDLKFVPESFEVCTAFFSLMYVSKSKHLRVFKEVHRILKNGGNFLLWDVNIPTGIGSYKAFMVRLKIRLPDEDVEAGYGVKWQSQDIGYFRQLGRKAEFQIVNEWSEGEIFHLELSK